MMVQKNNKQNRGNNVEFPPMGLVVCSTDGRAYATRDGEVVYDGTDAVNQGRRPFLLKDIERIAQADPNHDWRIHFDLPGYSHAYQRQNGNWVRIPARTVLH